MNKDLKISIFLTMLGIALILFCTSCTKQLSQQTVSNNTSQVVQQPSPVTGNWIESKILYNGQQIYPVNGVNYVSNIYLKLHNDYTFTDSIKGNVSYGTYSLESNKSLYIINIKYNNGSINSDTITLLDSHNMIFGNGSTIIYYTK